MASTKTNTKSKVDTKVVDTKVIDKNTKVAATKVAATKVTDTKVVDKDIELVTPVVVTPVVVTPVVVTPVVTQLTLAVPLEQIEVSIENNSIVSDKSDKSDKSDSIENAFINKLNIFTSKVAEINREVRELQTIGKTLEKDFNHVIKVISKQKKKNKHNENRPLSGFAMPSLLSEELYVFLKIEPGNRIPRKDVTRMLNDYIKANNLRDEKDKRKILPDDNLKKIFNWTPEDNITYFNLQTYVKHHFIKDIKVVTPDV
jgi:chromatin remodeling complex protein RSC6